MRERAQSASIEDVKAKPKRARQSEQQFLSFLQYCLFCGGKCDIVKDSKHPDIWCSAYICRVGETFGNRG